MTRVPGVHQHEVHGKLDPAGTPVGHPGHVDPVCLPYFGHHDVHRSHRALHQHPPAGYLHPPALGANVRILRRDRLGGLIHEYSQVA
jgi:hypothetical protein